MKGIRARWVRNYVWTTVIIAILLNVAFIFVVRNLYENNAYHALSSKATLSADFYSKYFTGKDYTLQDISGQVLKDFQNSGLYEVQIFNEVGSLTQTSTGMAFSGIEATKDVLDALNGKTGYWKGSNYGTGEKVMSSAVALKTTDGKILGAIRVVTSMAKIDKWVAQYSFVSVLIFSLICLILMALSFAFSRSILDPIYEIIAAARLMAEGKYNTRIKKHYNDELGELAMTLNDMAEEIQNSEKLKNDFISSISHEIRTPLTAISGWGETILTGGLEDQEEVNTGLKIIVKESNRLTTMVEELLDFSRMENGRLTLTLEPVSILTELSELMEIYRRKAQQKDVVLSYEAPEEVLYVEADRNRLRQVLINVVDNAIKFTPEGKTVQVRVRANEAFVWIWVIDEGIGIDPADLSFVTKKFFKVSNRSQGSGLGLAIASEIIQMHDGRLTVESQKNAGTQISIQLNRVDQEGNKGVVNAAKRLAGLPTKKGINITRRNKKET